MNRVYNENCLKTMDLMADNLIDLVVTSPPYDKVRVYNGYSFEFKKVADSLFRVIAIGGVLIWVVCDSVIKGSETGTSFRQALYFMECGFNLHDTMIWNKQNVFGTAGNPPTRYQQAFEYIFVFTKGRIKTFNAIKTDCVAPGRVYWHQTRRDRRKNHTTDCLKEKRDIVNADTKIVNNIFTYEVGWQKTSSDKIAFKHPAIFPDALAHDMIISWSNESDLIYDPFAGSGTTLKMAKLNNRCFIGSEISKEYCDIINDRLLML